MARKRKTPEERAAKRAARKRSRAAYNITATLEAGMNTGTMAQPVGPITMTIYPGFRAPPTVPEGEWARKTRVRKGRRPRSIV